MQSGDVYLTFGKWGSGAQVSAATRDFGHVDLRRFRGSRFVASSLLYVCAGGGERSQRSAECIQLMYNVFEFRRSKGPQVLI